MIEIRALAGPGDIDANDDGTIFGLAIPYNRETVIGDLKDNGFREQIAPGACSKSIREADIVALFNHNSGQPLGRTSANNLTLKNTTRGVEPELKPSDTTYGRDLATLVRDGVIRGWSFGFEVIRDEWTNDKGEPSDQWSGTNRCIREMRLAEVSPCTFPAYEMTTISNRDAASAAREGRGEKREDVSDAGGGQPDGRQRTPVQAARRALKLAKRAARDAREAERDVGDPMKQGTANRIPQISAETTQAILALQADTPDVATALALLGAVVEHAQHITKKEKIKNDGSGVGNRSKTSADTKRDKTPKPDDESTSTESLSDDALRASFTDACRREIDLGL